MQLDNTTYIVQFSVSFAAKNAAKATDFALNILDQIIDNQDVQSAKMSKLVDVIDTDEPIPIMTATFPGPNNYPGHPV